MRRNIVIFQSDNTNLNIKNAVGYLTFPALENYSFVKHAFSTRFGGVSEGQFKSMNLSFYNDDKKENVVENYHLFCEALGLKFETLVAAAQNHGDNIRIVGKNEKGIGIYRDRDMQSVDGLLTNCEEVTLVTYHADCAPIFFLDRCKKVIGLVHSGWRGTAKEIAGKMVSKMQREFACQLKDITCVVGPCVDECCYEVGEEVYEKFVSIPDVAVKSFMKKCDANLKYILNIKEANKQILLKAGISEENIVISDVCTCCYIDLFFSQRAMGNNRGTLAAFFCLKN
jgi:YfiH family protein